MPRSRADIERDIATLQAELAATQPDELRLTNVYEDARLGVRRAHSTRLRAEHVVLTSDGLAGKAFKAGELRDWLNYHFPKTEETLNV